MPLRDQATDEEQENVLPTLVWKVRVLGLPVQSSARGLREGGCANTLLMRCCLHVTRDIEIRDLGAPGQLGASGMGQELSRLRRRRPRVGGAAVTPGVRLVGPWGRGLVAWFRGGAGLAVFLVRGGVTLALAGLRTAAEQVWAHRAPRTAPREHRLRAR